MNSCFVEPWHTIQSLAPAQSAALRRRAIFECCKWDPQVEDVETLAPFAIVLKPALWHELRRVAQELAAETIELERELVRRPDLHGRLAIPRPIRSALAKALTAQSSAPHLRVMRFDFHPTVEGWRVSEVNTDVPGGYNEASGWTALVAAHVACARPTADPIAALVQHIRERVPQNGIVALVHATAYTDDRQVMVLLARRLEEQGLRPVLAAPDHVEWQDGRPMLQTDWFWGPVDFIFRFFPAEWLPHLGPQSGWAAFFGQSRVPLCNPATAVLTQSKRWPLVAELLGLELPAWKQFMPRTCDPHDVDWRASDRWVLKPALGRVGELVGVRGATDVADWQSIHQSLRWCSRRWVAQERFEAAPIMLNEKPWHACFGVYTINGIAAGIYGRIADRPLINHLARDVAVLVEEPQAAAAQCTAHEDLRAI